MKKQIFSIICSLALTACAPTLGTNTHKKAKPSSKANEEFTEFLNQDFKDTLMRDYTTLHQYLVDPQAAGIDVDKVDVNMGHIGFTEQDKKDHEALKEKMASFDYSSLDETQQAIYDQYEFDNEIVDELIKDKYKYLGNNWSSGGGAASNLVNYFESIYTINNEQDIKNLIILIEDCPRYTNDIMEHTRTQAEKGLLSFNYEEVISSLDTTIASQENSTVYQSLSAQVDALKLSDEKAEKYKTQICEALDKDFYPCFTTMKTGLEELKDQVQPYTGLANKENGKKYYEMILRSNTGTEKSPTAIRRELASALTKEIAKMNAEYEEAEIITQFDSPEAVLQFQAENYEKHYPKVDIPEYNIQDLPDEQCSPSVVAYYVPTPIDDNSTNQMRFNQRDYGQETTTVDFYTTFCHEGIPGHMYQHAYNRQNFQYDIQHLLDCSAFTEGFASYIQGRSLYDLENVSKSSIRSYNALNNINNYLVCMMDIDINYNGLTFEEFSEMYGDLFGQDAMEGIYNQLCDIPGTFLSYYYGAYRIEKLRDMAEDELGDKFDEVKFHDALLKYGSMNFEIVENSIDQYIEENE